MKKKPIIFGLGNVVRNSFSFYAASVDVLVMFWFLSEIGMAKKASCCRRPLHFIIHVKDERRDLIHKTQ